MPQLDYPTFRLIPSCAEDGGYLVQAKSTNNLIATIIRHPDDAPAMRWEVRAYYDDSREPGGRHRLLREAADAAMDEWGS